MTWLQLYALIGVPVILLAIAFAALKLTERDARRLKDQATKSGH